MSARTRKDWILWGALGCALVSTAHAEYTLATAAHFNEYVALAVPGALDLYVVRALQQRRDVFVAVLAMVAANVASHLIVGGVLAVNEYVIAAVGAVAPLIVWRVYSLKYTRTRKELLYGLEAGAVSAPAPEDEYTRECTCSRWRRVLVWLGWGECRCEKPQVSPHSPPSAPAPDLGCVWGHDECSHSDGECVVFTKPSAASAVAPDHVPGWMQEEYPASAPALEPSAPASAPHLHALPDLPPEYIPSAVHSESPLTEKDLPFVPGAQRYVDDVANPSVRGLMKALSIGQDRAGRLLTHLGVLL